MRIPLFTKEQLLLKMKQYCTYQERCVYEVKHKLYSFDVFGKDADTIVLQLAQENYLNEERFAIQFAGGRFRAKKWGKVKIKYALKEKMLSDSAIKKALSEIAESDYQKTLLRLAEQKLAALTGEKNSLVKKKKLHDYLLQKGYESSLVKKITDKKL